MKIGSEKLLNIRFDKELKSEDFKNFWKIIKEQSNVNIAKSLSEELNIKTSQAQSVIRLIDEGNTIPFIARYRKEATGSLDDEVLRRFDERLKTLI